jgi:hypothetical protein
MRFYLLRQRPNDDTIGDTQFWPTDDCHNTGDALHCPACGGSISFLKWLPPYHVELEMWSPVYGDAVYGSGEAFLVSERFTILWREHGLKGLSDFDPVKVVDVDQQWFTAGKPPKYFKVCVSRSRTTVDHQASGLEFHVEPGEQIKPVCPECLTGGPIERWQRIVFVPDTWSGDDIFFVRGLSDSYFVSERFRDFVNKFKLTNCSLLPIEKFAGDLYNPVRPYWPPDTAM